MSEQITAADSVHSARAALRHKLAQLSTTHREHGAEWHREHPVKPVPQPKEKP